jgi:hypothetical protein
MKLLAFGQAAMFGIAVSTQVATGAFTRRQVDTAVLAHDHGIGTQDFLGWVLWWGFGRDITRAPTMAPPVKRKHHHSQQQ